MTAVAFVHGHTRRPVAWRGVSDHLPAHWAVVAPDLFTVARVGAEPKDHRDSMVTQINRDLAHLEVLDPAVIVAEGVGAIPAIRYALEHPGRTAGIFLSGPRLHVGGRDIFKMKAGIRLHREVANAATHEQSNDLLGALKGVDLREAAGNVSVPRRVVVGERDRAGRTGADELKALGWEHAVVAEAEWDWFSYAPSAFAAHIVKFVEDHDI